MDLSFKWACGATIDVGQCSVDPSVGLTLLLVRTDPLGKITTADELRTGTLDLIGDTGAPEVSDESWDDEDISDA